MEEIATLPSFTDNQKFLMKKALYYDFMLFNRNQKPFNAFLIKKGLRNSMYTSNASGNSIMSNINRYDVGLHGDLTTFPNNFNFNENINLAFLSETFKNPILAENKSIFNPETSEEIDQAIKTLVHADNLTPNAPLYECYEDQVMKAIEKGRFDQFLSSENKEDMKKICTAKSESESGFGGKNRRIKKSKSKSKKTKQRSSKSRSRSRSKSKSRSRSKVGGAPPSYVGSIQGKFINDRGQQLFRNPVGGIA